MATNKPQSLKEWAMAGGGVPLQYKDRPIDWHRKVAAFAAGGEVHMGPGGVIKGVIGKAVDAVKGTQKVLPAVERDANLSKFLDASHEKRRLYHATPADFKEFQGKGFDPTISGNATWLTPNKEKQPAAHNTSSRTQVYREGVNVMPVHIKAERPLVLDDKNMEDWAKAVYANDSPDFPFLIAPDSLKKIKEDGYDSIFHPRSGEVIMLEPNKIKSAIGNRGTYDINEADINKAVGGAIHMDGGGAAFYPRVGNIKAKNFKPAKPMPIMDDPRAMELPQDIDLSIPTRENLEMSRRMAQREADLKRQQEGDRSPLEKLAGGVQAGRFLGSALTQGINAMPTRVAKGDEAADKFMQERLYKPEQPTAYEYAGDVGDFLEKLETDYKIPPVLPEAMALQYLTGPAASQAMRAAGKGAMKGAQALEKTLDPMVTQALDRGGLQSDLLLGLGQGAQANVIKPKGGNFLTGSVERDLAPLRRRVTTEAIQEGRYTPEQAARLAADPQTKANDALNNWVDSNLGGYVKNEMATPEDPLRLYFDRRALEIDDVYAKDIKRAERIAQRAADEPDPRRKANFEREASRLRAEASGNRDFAREHITHKTDLRNQENARPDATLMRERKEAGFPEQGMGQSPLAKAWERASDEALAIYNAGEIQDAPEKMAQLEQAKQRMVTAKDALDKKFLEYAKSKGMSEDEANIIAKGMPLDKKAELVGDTDFMKANIEYLGLNLSMGESYAKMNKENPWIAKVDPKSSVYSSFTGDLGFDHIMDVLREDLAAGRIRPEQMNKISITDAVRRTAQYDQELAKKMNEARVTARADLPVYKDYPEGYRWVELNKPGSFAAESEAMGHSVRGYEPPKGHPDWVEGSGNSGSSGYGHGGWEAIKSGKAKVYSLVDPKGAPHATVEVGANRNQLRREDLLPFKEAALEEAKKLPNGYTSHDLNDIEIRMARENMPAFISQIKGKQNRAPNEEYLPYVQDFVKGGNWSNVGDPQNAGLRRYGDVFNVNEQRAIEASGQPVPNHEYLSGEDIQRLHNVITPEGKRLKYDAKGNIVGSDEGLANGGEVHMQAGGLAKILKGAIKAPDIIVPSRMTELKDLIRKSEGEYAAKRLERAADEIPNLERMYKLDALKQAFTGDNAKAVATMHPADFERYAVPLEKKTSVGPKAAELAKKGDIDKYTVTTDEYLKHLQRIKGGFDDAAFLSLVKQEAGLPLMPYIRGHEGRHRSRALADQGETKSLVRILPGGDLREGLPRRSQEEFIDALRQEMEQTGKLVLPEKYFDEKAGAIQRPAIELPDLYAKGGEVHMGGGGAALKAALAKLGKFATEADVAAIKEAGRATHEQEAFIRAAKNANVEKRLQSMPPRSKAANMEMGMYHPVGGGLKLTKPFEALHSTRVPNPKVNKPDVKILTPEDLYKERAGLFPLVGDKADTGTFLTHIGEKELEIPIGLGGGPRYMDANFNLADPFNSAAWESGTGRTTTLGNRAQSIAEGDIPAYGIYTAGSGTNTDFNIMGANAVLQQIGQSKLTKKAEKAFDKAMREEGTEAFPPMPDWPGIRSPQVEDMLLDKSNGIVRTKMFDTMGKENFQSMGFPDVPATRKAIMDPQLYDAPTHEAGFRIARMDPTGRIVEDPLHPSDYPTAMAGELAGQLDKPVDYKDMFSTHFANRRLLSQPESGDYRSFSRAFPIQYADQEWLDKIMKAQEAKDKLIKTGKYAEGGEVHMQVGGLSKVIKAAVKKAPQEEALKLAQQRAKNIGQSENPRTRMLQQGYEDDWYHGSTGDIKRFNPNLLGESTGAQSAKKGFFFARDPSTPPAHMLEHDPWSVAVLKKVGAPIPPKPTMKGHGAETAGSYAGTGGSREYKEAMRKAKSAEKSGNWNDQEKYMTQAEDAVTNEMRYRQGLVAQHGDARDDMLEKIQNAWYGAQNSDKFKNMSQSDYNAYDKLFKELMPYGWYTSPLYEKPQFKNLIDQISSVTGEKHAKEAADAINKYVSVRNERAAADVESGANVLPVALRYKNPMYHDFEGKSYREQTYSDLVDEAKRKGHDALILKNTFDPGGSAGVNKMVDVGVVFDPDQIRSRFAAFDPLRKTAATAAAAGLAAPDLLAEEKKKSRGGLSSIK